MIPVECRGRVSAHVLVATSARQGKRDDLSGDGNTSLRRAPLKMAPLPELGIAANGLLG